MTRKKSGKAPQGRAKQKQKAQKATGSSWATYGRDDLSLGEDDDLTNITFRGFNGATRRVTSNYDPSIKLRHRAINFISAGSNIPRDSEKVEEVDLNMIAAIELNDEELETPLQLDGAVDSEQMDTEEPAVSTKALHHKLQQETSAESVAIEQPSTALQFVVDVVGDPNAPSFIMSRQAIRATSPVPSDSSEEVILFQGRNKPVVIDDPPMRVQSATVLADTTELSASSTFTIPTPPSGPESALEDKHRDAPSRQAQIEASAPKGFMPVPEGAFWRRGGPKNVQELAATATSTPTIFNTAQIAMENQETAEMLQAAWNQVRREKSAREDKEDYSSNTRRGKRGRKRSNKLLRNHEDSDPEEAAYQDYLENIRAQKLLDEAEEELEHNVPDVAEAANFGDEQDWEDTEMTAGDSDTDSDDEVIGEDLSDALDEDDGLNASDLESSELEEELNRAEHEMLQAEEALYMRRIQSRSDAHVARLWQKQIELGIESDELVIDDGDDLDGEGVGDLEAARAGFIAFSGRNAGKRSKRRVNQDSFPDASALADSIDQYGNEGFDIMDFDRPSLRPTKKGRKGKMPPELDALSDEELKDNMLSAWDRDRAKKRLKKAEREELRAQGLLGPLAKKGKADLGQKYHQGMTMSQVYDELLSFLDDEGKTTQPFPPMDKVDRKALHVVANALKLKSKSIGTGVGRYPVLYKTKNTIIVDESALRRIVNRSSRGFLKNQSHTSGSKKSVKRTGGGGASMGATGLRHGEVVGAGAKEIGKENFGHKLMEKMGWSKGMALGKNGEGMLVPVEQTMRIGRGGLG